MQWGRRLLLVNALGLRLIVADLCNDHDVVLAHVLLVQQIHVDVLGHVVLAFVCDNVFHQVHHEGRCTILQVLKRDLLLLRLFFLKSLLRCRTWCCGLAMRPTADPSPTAPRDARATGPAAQNGAACRRGARGRIRLGRLHLPHASGAARRARAATPVLGPIQHLARRGRKVLQHGVVHEIDIHRQVVSHLTSEITVVLPKMRMVGRSGSFGNGNSDPNAPTSKP
mmetsp:Transcript_158036/g.506901  ORF Transcript_158036/g.506901 Transcript_158036/m.506901 type:complete len:225 (+) Transcript_158036:2321-2995(+)